MRFSFSYGWSPKPKIHLAIALFMFIITGLLSIFLFKSASDNLAMSVIVSGVVVDSKINNEGMHAPVIKYESSDGKSYTFLSGFSSNPKKYFKGDVVEVVISKEDTKPRLKNFFTIYGLPLFAAIFSFICLIGSIGIYFRRVRKVA